MSFVRVAAAADVPEGRGLEVVAGGRVVGLFRVDSGFYAIDGICPHSGGPLASGYCSGMTAVCPWHGWQFDVASGSHRTNPTITQETFAVEVRGDDLYIELPDPPA